MAAAATTSDQVNTTSSSPSPAITTVTSSSDTHTSPSSTQNDSNKSSHVTIIATAVTVPPTATVTSAQSTRPRTSSAAASQPPPFIPPNTPAHTPSTYASSLRLPKDSVDQNDPEYNFDEMVRSAITLEQPMTYPELLDVLKNANLLGEVSAVNLNRGRAAIELQLPNRKVFDRVCLHGINIRNQNVRFIPLVRANIIKVFNVPVQYDGELVHDTIRGFGYDIMSYTNVSVERHGYKFKTGEIHFSVKKRKNFRHIPTVVKLFGGRWVGFRYPGQPDPDRHTETPIAQEEIVFSKVQVGETPEHNHWYRAGKDGKQRTQQGAAARQQPHEKSEDPFKSPPGETSPDKGIHFNNKFKDLNFDTDTNRGNLQQNLDSEAFHIMQAKKKIKSSTTEEEFINTMHSDPVQSPPNTVSNMLPSPIKSSTTSSHPPLSHAASTDTHVSHLNTPTSTQESAYIDSTNNTSPLLNNSLITSTTYIYSFTTSSPIQSTHTITSSSHSSQPDLLSSPTNVAGGAAKVPSGAQLNIHPEEHPQFPADAHSQNELSDSNNSPSSEHPEDHPQLPDAAHSHEQHTELSDSTESSSPEHPIEPVESEEEMEQDESPAVSPSADVGISQVDVPAMSPSSEDDLSQTLVQIAEVPQQKPLPDPPDSGLSPTLVNVETDPPEPEPDPLDPASPSASSEGGDVGYMTVEEKPFLKHPAGAGFTDDEGPPDSKKSLSTLLHCGSFQRCVPHADIQRLTERVNKTNVPVTLFDVFLYANLVASDFSLAKSGYSNSGMTDMDQLMTAALYKHAGSYDVLKYGPCPDHIKSHDTLLPGLQHEIYNTGTDEDIASWANELLNRFNVNRTKH